jgi:hypothetical protein
LIYLSEPVWIWVSAGIIVPILIHLARGHAGKTLRIGTIFFLKENIISQASSLKIREWLLLFLRCLAIMLTAMYLSKPIWRHPFLTGNKKGWLVMEKSKTRHSMSREQPLIDSLLKNGYELRLLDKDFPKTGMEDIMNSADSSVSPVGYWQQLRQLQQIIPADMPVYFFTGNKLNRFSGNRPDLSLNLHWIFFEEQDTITKWLSAVHETPGDSIHMLTGNSHATGTWYQTTIEPKKVYEQNSPDKMKTDTSELVVSIYSGEGRPDGGYVVAALEAVRDYGHHKMVIHQTTNMDSVKGDADWIWWLSDSTMPVSFHPKNLFRYQPGRAAGYWSSIYPTVFYTPDPVPVFQIVTSPGDSLSDAIWSDGFGRPVLVRNKREKNVFLFFSRFDPAWNGLPWSASFPAFFLNLLYPAISNDNDWQHDQRRISSMQAFPDIQPAGENVSTMKFQDTDLSRFFWLSLFIVFCIERFVSLKKKEVLRA